MTTARNYAMVSTPEELQAVVDRLGTEGAIGFDVETGYDGPDREKGALRAHEGAFVTGFSLSGDPSWARWVPIRHDEGPTIDPAIAWEIVSPLLTTGERVVAHNAKFEVRMMRNEGVELSLRSDTMIEAFLTAQYPTNDLGLKSLVQRCFGHEQAEIISLFPKGTTKKALKSMRFNVLPSDRPDVVSYACEDAAWCLALHHKHYDTAKALAKGGLFKIDMAILGILADMEDWGVEADWPAIEKGRVEGEEFAVRYEEIVRKGLDDMLKAHRGEDASIDAFAAARQKRFNLGSTKQLGTLLYDPEVGLGIPPVKLTDSGAPSTDSISLNALAKEHEPVKMLLKLREVWNLTKRHAKWLEEYTGATDGRVHASYGQTVIASARFNAGDPAIQQIPKKWSWEFTDPDTGEERAWKGNYRSYIVAAPGTYYLGFDYSQIELRFMAGLARETALLEAFNNGADVHSLTAAMMLDKPVEELDHESERPIGKTMNFALLYQMGVKSLADRLAVSRERAQELYDGYFQSFPAIASWQAEVTQEAKNRGGRTLNYFGRIATVWELVSGDRRLENKGERMLVNIPVQGGAADYMRLAMVRARLALEKAGLWGDVKLVINMHDALTFEVRNHLHPQAMLDILVPAVEFPVTGMPRMLSEWEIGQSWGSGVEFDYEDVEFEFSEEMQRWTVVGSDPQPVDNAVDDDEFEEPDDEEIAVEAPPEPAPEPVRNVAMLVVEIPEMPYRAQWDRFVALVGQREGKTSVLVKTPEGDVELMHKTSMTPADSSRVAVCLPGSRVFHPEGSVDVDSIGEGLTL